MISPLAAGVQARRPMRLPELDRPTLRTHLRTAWALTDWLFSGIPDDADLYENPDRLRNPLVFYLGRPPGHPTYGWDNEYGRRDVEVRPFRVSAAW